MTIVKNSSKEIIVFLLLASLLVCLFFLNNKKIMIFAGEYKIAARNEICQLAEAIKPGDKYEDVEKTFQSLDFKVVRRIYRTIPRGYLVVTAPIELPGFTTQWELVLVGENEIVKKIVLKDIEGIVRSCPYIPAGVR